MDTENIVEICGNIVRNEKGILEGRVLIEEKNLQPGDYWAYLMCTFPEVSVSLSVKDDVAEIFREDQSEDLCSEELCPLFWFHVSFSDKSPRMCLTLEGKKQTEFQFQLSHHSYHNTNNEIKLKTYVGNNNDIHPVKYFVMNKNSRLDELVVFFQQNCVQDFLESLEQISEVNGFKNKKTITEAEPSDSTPSKKYEYISEEICDLKDDESLHIFLSKEDFVVIPEIRFTVALRSDVKLPKPGSLPFRILTYFDSFLGVDVDIEKKRKSYPNLSQILTTAHTGFTPLPGSAPPDDVFM